MKIDFKIIALVLLGLLALILVFSIIMFISTKGEYSVPLTVEQDPSIPHVQIGDGVFHAETFGSDSAQTIIILHGGPGNDYRYLLPLKDLSEDYFVVFYDQRGTGLSPRVGAAQHSLEQSLSDLHGFVETYGRGKKVHLLGHSWGGMLISGFIAQYPGKVDKVVIAEPGMLTSEKAREYKDAFRIEPSWSMIRAMTRAYFESWHVKKIDNQARIDYLFGRIATMDLEGNPMKKYFCNEDMATGHLPFWRLSGLASRSIREGAQDEKGEMELDLVSGLEDFQGRVLFITGECSQILGASFQEGHIKYFPNAELVEIQGAGHTMFGEKPEECLALIREYFRNNH